MKTAQSIGVFILRYKWIVGMTLITVLAAGWGIRLLMLPEAPQYVTAQAHVGDLVQTVEAVGQITSEKDLELKFPVSGLVEKIHVTEGDLVVVGQILSELRSKSQTAVVDSARGSYHSALADLKTLQEGARPEDIAITEAEVENKRAALELARTTLRTADDTLARSEKKITALRKEAKTSLAGFVARAGSTVSKEMTTARTAIRVIDDVLEDVNIQDITIRNNVMRYELLKKEQYVAESSVQTILSAPRSKDFEKALSDLEGARGAALAVIQVMGSSYELIATMPTTSYFTVAAREDAKSTLAAERASVESVLRSLDIESKDLRDASANFATKIATEETTLSSTQGIRDKAAQDIFTFETALRITQAQLDLKKAGTRKSEIDAAAARVRKAQAELDRAIADLEDTKLFAPIAGTITKVNLKPGEFTPGQFTQTEPAIVLLGISPYRVEMEVAEVDIPKVRIGQSGSIVLDAFPGITYALYVSEIDPAATSKSGVPKYLVTLDFVYPHEEFKIGMTGDAKITTAVEKDVIVIPARAVLEDDNQKPFVRVLLDGLIVEERPVETGLEGVNDIAIRSGLSVGETVVVLQK